tara:strand:+ start:6437 stop:6757 length:321 start_codon:yes stop_codon:yes gene_type:complete
MSYLIHVQELKERLDNGDDIFLLDVRESWEYSMAKIDGSVLITLGELSQSFDQLDKEVEIVCYCHHGIRSVDATILLHEQGFHNVKSLEGGIDAWSVLVEPSVPRY